MLAAKLNLVLAVTIMVTGCTFFQSKSEKPDEMAGRVEDLRKEVSFRREQYRVVADKETGWPDPMDCDGVLHAGVARAGGVEWVRTDLMENGFGKLGRRVSTAAPCWTLEQGDVGSKSETSGDMAQGFLLAAWRARDLGAVERLAAYGEAHSVDVLGLPAWVLGDPYPDEAGAVLMKPGAVGLVGRMLEALTDGAVQKDYRVIPAVYGADGEDYQEALAVRGIVLNGEVMTALGAKGVTEGGFLIEIDGAQFEVLKKLAERRPFDPLFQAAYARYSGDYEPAYDALFATEMICPSYTRGSLGNCLANWLFAASIVLKNEEE